MNMARALESRIISNCSVWNKKSPRFLLKQHSATHKLLFTAETSKPSHTTTQKITQIFNNQEQKKKMQWKND